MNFRNKIYGIGVIVTLLGLAGIAEAVTGQGSMIIAILTLGVGFGCVLVGYTK